MQIPIPETCNQKWVDMPETKGGRMCHDCNKVIVDFSQKSWTEIDEILSVSNYTTCGMYSKQQVRNWGGKKHKKKIGKVWPWLASGLLLSNAASVVAQDTTQLKKRTTEEILKDYEAVVSKQPYQANRTLQGNVYAIVDDKRVVLQFANFFIVDTEIGGITDAYGAFTIPINNNLPSNITLNFLCFECDDTLIEVSLKDTGTTELSVEMKMREIGGYFRVEPPSLWNRITHPFRRLRRWFGWY